MVSPENAYAPLAFEIVDEVLVPDKPNWIPESAAPLGEVIDPEIVKVEAGVGVTGVGVAVVGVLVPPPPPPQADIRATLNKSHAQSDVLEIMFSGLSSVVLKSSTSLICNPIMRDYFQYY